VEEKIKIWNDSDIKNKKPRYYYVSRLYLSGKVPGAGGVLQIYNADKNQ
jgi:hypothetical protein